MDKRNLSRAKWFVFGVLFTLMLSGTALMASPVMREIVFGISVSLDDDIIQFEDDMQPFIMDGRTFLPVRAIADIVGLGVDFDGDTNTVILTTDSVAAAPTPNRPLRGTWYGNVYANEYLRLRFTLIGDWWVVYTDAEIAGIVGITTDVFYEGGANIPDDIILFTDMMASNPYMGVHVEVFFERLLHPMTVAEYLEMVKEGVGSIGGIIITDFPGTTRIGGYDWYSFGTELHFEFDFGTIITYGRRFITVQDGFARAIIISYNDSSRVTPEDILAMFSDL